MAQLWNKIKSFLGFKKKEETVMVGSFKPVEPKGWDSVENAVQTDPERVPERKPQKEQKLVILSSMGSRTQFCLLPTQLQNCSRVYPKEYKMMEVFDTIDKWTTMEFIWVLIVLWLYVTCFGAIYMFYKDFIKPKTKRRR